MSALSKAELADSLISKFRLNKSQAKNLVEVFFEALRKALESGHHVKLSRFGNFILRDKSERPGRNPKTREPIPVKARRVVTFRAGVKLKRRIENMSNLGE